MCSEVVVGIVTKDQDILIVKRKEGEGHLRWQFPGGTLEEKETDEQALLREIKEETGCNINIKKLLGQRIHPYTHKAMSYWACEYIGGEINISDEDLEDARWVNKFELTKYFTTSIFEPILAYLDLI